MITTKSDLRRTIRAAETTAVLLRQPGHVPMTRGAREKIAAMLEDLAIVARRAFDPFARHDLSVEPAAELVEGPEDHPELFDGGSA